MGTNECSQPASESSWDSQDVGDISMVLKMAHFSPPGHGELNGHKKVQPWYFKQSMNFNTLQFTQFFSIFLNIWMVVCTCIILCSLVMC